MIRLLTIPVALAALAVTAAPASAGLLSSPLGVSASANGHRGHRQPSSTCRRRGWVVVACTVARSAPIPHG